jgi:hypothetical protein
MLSSAHSPVKERSAEERLPAGREKTSDVSCQTSMTNALCRIRPYFPMLILGLILISPLIPTGLPIKKYTRLYEIVLAAVMVAIFWEHVATRKKIASLSSEEALLLAIGISLTVSNLYGYFVLDMPLGWIDFYQVFNVVLFACYFRVGTFIDCKKIRKSAIVMLGFLILCMDVLSISQLTPWGYHHILPLYMPAGMIQSSGYEIAFIHEGTIGRVVGTLSSPTSFSVILVIVALLLAGWILYIPTRKAGGRILSHGLLVLSVFVLFMTFSRSGLLSFFVSFSLLLGFAHFVDKRSIVGVAVSILIAVLFYLSMQWLPGDTVAGVKKESLRSYRIEHTFAAQEEGSYVIAEQTPNGVHKRTISDFNNRVILWTMGLEKAMISPILGWGTGSTSALESKRLGLEETVRGFHGAHNEYIELTIQTGIVGLLLIVSFFALVLIKSNRVVKTGSTPFQLYVARTVQAIIAGIAVFCLFDGIWNNNVIPPLLMTIFGSLYAADPN